jgi:hypothetical protein
LVLNRYQVKEFAEETSASIDSARFDIPLGESLESAIGRLVILEAEARTEDKRSIPVVRLTFNYASMPVGQFLTSDE